MWNRDHRHASSRLAMLRLYLIPAVLVFFPLVLAAADAHSRLDCAAGLAPDITTLKQNYQLSIIYLKTLTSDQYEEAKHNFSTDFPGLFGANYDDYLNRRSHYFEDQHLNYDEQRSLDIYISKIPESARKDYFKCVEQLAAKTYGLYTEFVDEKSDAATLKVFYNNSPTSGESTKVSFQMMGVTKDTKVKTKSIDRGGYLDVQLKRDKPGSDIRVSANGAGFSDSAVSAALVPVPVYETVDVPHVEALVLHKLGSYHFILGDVYGKDLHYAELRPSVPGATFEDVALLHSENGGHWFRCEVQTPCDTLEFTPTAARSKDATCRGSATCVVWRLSNDSENATDTFEMHYLEHQRRCVENCGHKLPNSEKAKAK